MRFQALLLSFIILSSVLISGAKFPPAGSSKEAPVQTTHAEDIKPAESNQPAIGQQASVFMNDLYSALSEKTVSANQDLNDNLSAVAGSLNQGFAAVADNLNRNFSAVKEIFSANVSGLFSKNPEPNPEAVAESSSSVVSNSDSYQDLVSKPEIDAVQTLPCNPPDQSAFVSKAMLVRYLNDNFNIFEANSDKRWPIASISKLMTAVVAFEKMDLSEKITINEEILSTEGEAGNLKVGEIYTLEDLIKAMLVTSSNRAAMAIAEDFGKKDFVNEMQKKAAELQMFQTTYLEPTGLSFVNQSTANDLAKLMTYIYFNHPEILEISRQKEIKLTDLKSGKINKLFSIDKFAGDSNFIGGKTGYIDESGRNFIALFEINGKTVLTIALGADDSFKETEKLKSFVTNCSD